MPEDLVVRAVRAVLVVREDPEVRVELAAQVVQVVSVALAALAGLANRVASVVLGVRVAPVAREPVPVAVPLRTKSATAAHHRGQVAVARVEDLRAVAETTREPAAAGAAIAWEAAA